MLKIYDVCDYVSIDGAKWREVGGGYKITDEEREDLLVLDKASFDEVYEFLNHGRLHGVWNDSTLFKHKPVIRISYEDAFDVVTYRHFDTMSYKIKYTERKDVSFQWLMEHLSADQFIQYLKERGITTCPMNF